MSAGGGSLRELGLAVRFAPHQVVVEVSGDIDPVTAPDLGTVLGALIDQGHTHLILDLAQVHFMDAAGLRIIADTSTRLRPRGGVLTIRSPSVTTRQMLDIAALSRLFEIESSDPSVAALGAEQRTGDHSRTVGGEPADLTVDLPRVAAVPAGHDVVDGALRLVTALAGATVGGADGVSVSLTRHGKLTTVAASDKTIAQMDRDQYATGQGPCLAAAAEGRWFHVESLAEEDRWPDFVPRALDGGIGSILSTPLMAAARPVGALNIYSSTQRAFGPREQELAALFATQASGILADAGVDVAAEEVIAQAQGVVMARHGVSAEVAFATLRRTAQQADVPVRRRAAEIVASTRQSAHE